VRLEHEAAVRGLLLPEGIDGGIVYEDPHLRLSEVLAVVDSLIPVKQVVVVERETLAVVLDEYLGAYWPVPEGRLNREARVASILNRLRAALETPGEPFMRLSDARETEVPGA